MADEVNVGGEVGQDALAAVSAVAANEDLVVRKPFSDQVDQFAGQFRTSAMVGIGRLEALL